LLPRSLIKELESANKVGGGGFGTVYSFYDTRKENLIAAKIITSRYSEKTQVEYLGVIKQASVNHTNILKIYGIFHYVGDLRIKTKIEDANQGPLLIILMPFYEENLATVSLKNPKHLIKILNDVANGLNFLHLQEIFHRDIKAHNILIKFDKTAKEYNAYISDFSLAQIEEEIPTDYSNSKTTETIFKLFVEGRAQKQENEKIETHPHWPPEVREDVGFSWREVKRYLNDDQWDSFSFGYLIEDRMKVLRFSLGYKWGDELMILAKKCQNIYTKRPNFDYILKSLKQISTYYYYSEISSQVSDEPILKVLDDQNQNSRRKENPVHHYDWDQL